MGLGFVTDIIYIKIIELDDSEILRGKNTLKISYRLFIQEKKKNESIWTRYILFSVISICMSLNEVDSNVYKIKLVIKIFGPFWF